MQMLCPLIPDTYRAKCLRWVAALALTALPFAAVSGPFEDLEKEGFTKEVIDALKCVTKTSEDEDYAEFTNRVKINPLAVKVKLNDLTDNLDIKRMPLVLESDLKRLNKYLKAYNELLNISQ